MGIERLLGVTVRIKVSSWVEQGGLRFQPYGEIQPRTGNITCNRKRHFISLSPERRDGVSPWVGGLKSQPYDENSHLIRPLKMYLS